MIYQFRAECQADVDGPCQLIPADELITLQVTPDPAGFPDRVVMLELKTTTLQQLQTWMWAVVDGPVMAQTVAAQGEYTGIRNYNFRPAVLE